jgi:hypothetical protein
MKKPKAVDLAVNALLMGTIVEIAGNILSGDHGLGGWVVDMCTYAFSLFLVFKIAKGKNWARVVMLAGFVLGIYCMMMFGLGAWAVSHGVLPRLKGAEVTHARLGAAFVDTLLTGYAIWLLFSKPACEWFESKQKEAAAVKNGAAIPRAGATER